MALAVAGTLLLAAALGFAVGRWWGIAAAAAAWPLYALGLWAGWWGNGFSRDDSAAVLTALFAGLAVAGSAGAAAGVALRRRLPR